MPMGKVFPTGVGTYLPGEAEVSPLIIPIICAIVSGILASIVIVESEKTLKYFDIRAKRAKKAKK